MRIVLVIFALWALVVEPTFEVFEHLEQTASQQHSGENNGMECDQQIPPSHVTPVQWTNDHLRVEWVVALFDSVALSQYRPDRLLSHLATLPADSAMPYPPAVLPLRL